MNKGNSMLVGMVTIKRSTNESIPGKVRYVRNARR